MIAYEARVAVACGDTLGESATWNAREGALYWIDIRGPMLHRLDPATGAHADWALPEVCGGVVPMASGVLLALERDLAHFDTDSAELTRLCSVEPASLGNRLNEMKCDRSGQLWVGSMRDFAAATTGALYRIDRDLTVRRMFTDITIPNGLGWSSDGGTMYFADTLEGSLRRYRIDATSGALDAAGALSESGSLPGAPDGSTVDREGHVWTTRFGAGRVIRLAPDGSVSATVTLPATQPTSCALGGPDLRTLYITTARQRLLPEQLRAQPGAGHLFAVEVEVPGLPDIEFDVDVPASRTGLFEMCG